MNMAATPLADWLARLETLSPTEIDLGLERVVQVLDRLALPRPATVLHIAGTNGKGSSVAMLESLLQQTGSRVGSYTSPHVIRYNERIRVNGRDASDDLIVAAFERVEAQRKGAALTYFEYGTLAALVVFADAGVDAAILEVGMGGRLDAVNAIAADAGLITNIALDHCDWLGDDIESIAFEKAGIMRKGEPVIFGARDVPQAILRHADAVQARLILAGRDFDWSREAEHWSWQGQAQRLEGLELPALPGDHQIGNAAAVLALLEAAGFVELLREDLVSESLRQLHLDGRMQRIALQATWLLDVAHNPAAATALADTLRVEDHAGRMIAIVGMLDDKDVEGVVAPLREQVDHWIAVTADSPRAIDAHELARRIANATNAACLVADSLDAAIGRAGELADVDDRVLVTGSFYLVGPVLTKLYSRRQS
ncbi:MAG: bifunctional tetrahydrofolate synthase/dihydrofolate synthase [Gammaproteobacteria bacterium]|nr:bifunctional tetrahydrofolate synthase/dihydrofolate synthase [Gammaproteobacteria bacterium]